MVAPLRAAGANVELGRDALGNSPINEAAGVL